MASKQSVVDFILEQIAGAGAVSARKMFGEYAIYCDAKLVALIADDELFVKPTGAGRASLGDVDERPPYPGAKPYYWIGSDRWDDDEALTALIRATAAALPVPPPKPPRASPAKPKPKTQPRSAAKTKTEPRPAPKPAAKAKAKAKPAPKPAR